MSNKVLFIVDCLWFHLTFCNCYRNFSCQQGRNANLLNLSTMEAVSKLLNNFYNTIWILSLTLAQIMKYSNYFQFKLAWVEFVFIDVIHNIWLFIICAVCMWNTRLCIRLNTNRFDMNNKMANQQFFSIECGFVSVCQCASQNTYVFGYVL